MEGAGKLGVLAGKVCCAVVLGERHAHSHMVAHAVPDDLLLKAGDEHSAAEHERLPLRRAALKRHAVHAPGVVEHDLVAGLRGAIRHRAHARRLLL